MFVSVYGKKRWLLALMADPFRITCIVFLEGVILFYYVCLTNISDHIILHSS